MTAKLERQVLRLRKQVSELTAPRVFIALGDGFICQDCMTTTEKESLGDPHVEVWQEGSNGWTGTCVCLRCQISIPVYVDGVEAENDEEPYLKCLNHECAGGFVIEKRSSIRDNDELAPCQMCRRFETPHDVAHAAWHVMTLIEQLPGSSIGEKIDQLEALTASMSHGTSVTHEG